MRRLAASGVRGAAPGTTAGGGAGRVDRSGASTEAMHVLDTTMLYGPPGGGVAQYLRAKREWLARAGCRHTMLVPGPRNGRGPDGEQCLATWTPRPGGWRWPVAPARWSRAIVRHAPDIIEAGDGGPLGWAALRAARELGVPLVAFCHADAAAFVRRRFGSASEAVAERYLAAFYRRCDAVVAPSEYVRDRLASWGVRGVVVRPLGVDLQTFRPQARSAALRHALAGGRRVMAYAGRFAPEKNLDVLLAAYARLPRDYGLLLIGRGDRVATPDNVRVLPHLESRRELAAVLASVDGLVHAGDVETFGLVVLEAMACGRGAVAAAAGGVREIVTPRTGVLAAPRDPDALAAAIRRFYERDVDATGRMAREHVERHYGWDGVMRGLLDLYTSLAEPDRAVRAA